MNKLLTLLAATAAVSLLPSGSQAACVATGTIPRIYMAVGVLTNIGVRDNGAPATFFNFTTTNSNVINAALNAESSHITVQVIGDAAACSAVVNGLSNGGNVSAILVSP
jgi:hypothetical protein